MSPGFRNRHVLLGVLAAITAIVSVVSTAGAADEPGDVGQELDTSLDGQTIVRVVVVRYDIFDTTRPETSSWPYRAANSLNIVTREGFIRSVILIKEGDPYSASKAAESGRLLRSLDFLNPVEITAHRVDGGVEMRVETHDQWTLQLGGQLGFFGGRSEAGAGFTDKNFLGWGRQVSVEWESDNERTALTYSFFDPNLFNTRWRARLLHKDTSHGYRDLVRVEYPFYSLATAGAGGGHWDRMEDREYLYSESESRVTGDQRSDGWTVWGGLRLPGGDELTRRLILAYDYRLDEFASWRSEGRPYPQPDDREISGVRVGYQQVADRFRVLSGFRAWTRQEDVALGPNLSLGATLSLPAFGGDIERLLLDGRLSAVVPVDGWLVVTDAWFEGRLDEGRPRNWLVGLEVAASQLGLRGWQARLRVEATRKLDLEHQLTLGADLGLRGWDPDYFDGTSRAVANLQWRTIIKEDILHFFSLGGVVFVDAGYTWNPRVGPGTERVHANVGVGLLADLTHIGLANLLRIDVGYPDDGTGYTISVTTSSLF